MTDYVWFRGRCWQATLLVDVRGWLELISLRDSSLGVWADPAKVRNCTRQEMNAIRWFLQRRRPSFCGPALSPVSVILVLWGATWSFI